MSFGTAREASGAPMPAYTLPGARALLAGCIGGVIALACGGRTGAPRIGPVRPKVQSQPVPAVPAVPAPQGGEVQSSPAQPDVSRAASAVLEARLIMPPELDGAASPISVSMAGPTGPTWSRTWSQPFGRRLGEAGPQLEAYGWFAGKGTYQLRVVLDGGASARAEVGLSGEEVAITAHALILPRENTGTPWIRWLRVVRVLAPPRGVVLRRAWTPTPDGTPKYELHNGGDTSLSGVVPGEAISGIVQRWEEGRWIVAPRGGWCATGGRSGEAAPPGASVATEELPFTGQPRPLLPGRYRYLVEYLSGFASTTRRVSADDRASTKVEVLTVHRSTDVFETAWSPTEWVRAHGGPLPDCEFRGALFDGRLRVAVAGRARPARFFGLETESPPSDDLLMILDRHGLTSWSNPPCEIRREGAVPQVKVLVQGQEAPIDLAEVVLAAGHAHVQPGDFPERARYLELERRAHAAPAAPDPDPPDRP